MQTVVGTDTKFVIGVLAVASMLGAYGLWRTSFSTLAFGIAWTLGAIFLLVEGLWPLAAIQALFALITFLRAFPRTSRRARASIRLTRPNVEGKKSR
jgi:hypothetical protein